MRRAASSTRVSRLSVSYDYGYMYYWSDLAIFKFQLFNGLFSYISICLHVICFFAIIFLDNIIHSFWWV